MIKRLVRAWKWAKTKTTPEIRATIISGQGSLVQPPWGSVVLDGFFKDAEDLVALAAQGHDNLDPVLEVGRDQGKIGHLTGSVLYQVDIGAQEQGQVKVPPLVRLADPHHHGPDLCDRPVLGPIEQAEFAPERQTPVKLPDERIEVGQADAETGHAVAVQAVSYTHLRAHETRH